MVGGSLTNQRHHRLRRPKVRGQLGFTDLLHLNHLPRLRANDFEDFRHACSALAYCDLFLTERRLMAMVTANHLALDRQYDCKVAAAIPDALALLRAE